MPYLRAIGDDAGSTEGEEPVEDLRVKMDALLAEQKRAVKVRKISIAVTGVGVLVSVVRLGDILRQMRKDRRRQ